MKNFNVFDLTNELELIGDLNVGEFTQVAIDQSVDGKVGEKGAWELRVKGSGR